jgi:hypothetical protein
MAVNGILGDKYGIFDATFKKYTTDLGETFLKEFIKYIDSDAGEFAEWAFITGKVVNCMPAAVSRCRRVANRWQEEESNLKRKLQNEYTAQEQYRIWLLAIKSGIENRLENLSLNRKHATDERDVIEGQKNIFQSKGEFFDLYVKLFGSSMH